MEAIQRLREEGYAIYVMETTSRSQVYTKITYPKPTAIVLGNELTGVCTEVRMYVCMYVCVYVCILEAYCDCAG